MTKAETVDLYVVVGDLSEGSASFEEVQNRFNSEVKS
jgi:hypothetical protein